MDTLWLVILLFGLAFNWLFVAILFVLYLTSKTAFRRGKTSIKPPSLVFGKIRASDKDEYDRIIRAYETLKPSIRNMKFVSRGVAALLCIYFLRLIVGAFLGTEFDSFFGFHLMVLLYAESASLLVLLFAKIAQLFHDSYVLNQN